MQAGVAANHRQLAAELLLDRLDQRIVPGAVNAAHAPDVAGVVAFGQKARQYRLLQGLALAEQLVQRTRKAVHQVGWQHQVGDAQCREQGLGKRAQVDHAAVRVQAL